MASSAPSAHQPFERVTAHHRDPKCRVDVHAELAADAKKPVGGGRVNLGPQQIAYLAQYYPIVQTQAELAALPEALAKKGRGEEFGITPVFMGAFVDATAQHGFFPMTLNLAKDLYVFSPKCHEQRSFTRICSKAPRPSKGKNAAAKAKNEEEEGGEKGAADECSAAAAGPSAAASTPSASAPPQTEPLFNYAKLGLSRRLLRRLEVRVHFHVVEGEQSMRDLHSAMAMIRRQHSENWLCAPLRSVVQHMLMAPAAYKTAFYVLVVAERRGEEGDDEEHKKGNENEKENGIVACDMGYIVGDICTAFTGAYEVSGTGTVTLGASAKLLELLRIPTWDLGMQMSYKAEALAATTQRRGAWLHTVKERRSVYAKEVAEARAELFGADGKAAAANGCEQLWVVPPAAGDATNSKCQSDLLKDPRAQAVMARLAAGVPAHVLMAASSLADLDAPAAVQKGGGPSCSLIPIAGGASHQESDNAHLPSNSSKSQQKKAAKAAAVMEKKQIKKANGNVLPPKDAPRGE